jgi:hypothetical protein
LIGRVQWAVRRMLSAGLRAPPSPAEQCGDDYRNNSAHRHYFVGGHAHASQRPGIVAGKFRRLHLDLGHGGARSPAPAASAMPQPRKGQPNCH